MNDPFMLTSAVIDVLVVVVAQSPDYCTRTHLACNISMEHHISLHTHQSRTPHINNQSRGCTQCIGDQ